MREHILKLPKVELHSHLEGTIKPHLVHQIAQRNGIELDQNLFNDKGKIKGCTKFFIQHSDFTIAGLDWVVLRSFK